MNIFMMPNLTREKAEDVTLAVCRKLAELDIGFVFDIPLTQQLANVQGAKFAPREECLPECEFILAVGGDGSVIRAAKTAAAAGKKLLGINAGRLAYLCDLDADELGLLSALVTGDYRVKKRTMLDAELIVDGKTVFADSCLNDIVFARGREIGLVDISVSANGSKISDYLADGVIFATPTGSTAYSLSAGGPIIDPETDVLSLTPVCPHSLTSRPFIFNADTCFEVRTVKRADSPDVFFSCDGGSSVLLPENGIVKIRKSDTQVDFVSIKTDTFIDVLNKKLDVKK